MGGQPSAGAVEAFLVLMGRMGDSTGAPVTGVVVANAVDGLKIESRRVESIGPDVKTIIRNWNSNKRV